MKRYTSHSHRGCYRGGGGYTLNIHYKRDNLLCRETSFRRRVTTRKHLKEKAGTSTKDIKQQTKQQNK